MLTYEEYTSKADKRQAQRGARRGVPTGKSRGYLFTFPENGHTPQTRCVEALALVDSTASPGHLATTAVSWEYLRDRCRIVSRKRLPQEWLSELKRRGLI